MFLPLIMIHFHLSPVIEMQVWLHASVKAKLVRQVLVQKERSLFRRHNLGEWWTPVSKTIWPFLLKSSVLKGIGRGGLFSLPYSLASF